MTSESNPMETAGSSPGAAPAVTGSSRSHQHSTRRSRRAGSTSTTTPSRAARIRYRLRRWLYEWNLTLAFCVPLAVVVVVVAMLADQAWLAPLLFGLALITIGAACDGRIRELRLQRIRREYELMYWKMQAGFAETETARALDYLQAVSPEAAMRMALSLAEAEANRPPAPKDYR